MNKEAILLDEYEIYLVKLALKMASGSALVPSAEESAMEDLLEKLEYIHPQESDLDV